LDLLDNPCQIHGGETPKEEIKGQTESGKTANLKAGAAHGASPGCLDHQVGSRATARKPPVKALVGNALGSGFDFEYVDIAAPMGREVLVKGIEEGAEVLVGGEGHPSGFDAGYFVKPTVFVNVRNDMTFAQEEIFGPVLCVIVYDTEEEAIRIANDTKYGLHAFVSGSDIQRARRVASRMLAGRVPINGMLDDPDAPWGGFKYSGIGREFGRYGIEAFLETRAILE
jgi:hypothetical protein